MKRCDTRLGKILALGAAGLLVLAVAPAGSATDSWHQVYPPEGYPGADFAPTVARYGGITAWSGPVDEAATKYGVYALVDGQIRQLPIATRSVPFDLDLGPDGHGSVVAAYSRCRVEPRTLILPLATSAELAAYPYPPWTQGKGCDLYRYDFATHQETKIAGASTRAASEVLPSIWKDQIAFVRVYEQRSGRRGVYPYLYVRGLASGATSRRQPGGSRGSVGLPGPTRLDLYGKRLSFVWNSVLAAPGSDERFRPVRSTLRLDTIDGGHRILSRAISVTPAQPGVASYLGPQGSNGRIHYGFQRSLLAEGDEQSVTSLLGEYRLSTGARSHGSAPDFLVDASVDGDVSVIGTGSPSRVLIAPGPAD